MKHGYDPHEAGRAASLLLVTSPASSEHLEDALWSCAQLAELLILATFGLPMHHRKPMELGLLNLAGRLQGALDALGGDDAPPAEASLPDPLLALVRRYEEAKARVDAGSEGEDHAAVVALSAAYFALKSAPPPVTREGAVAALRLLQSEMQHSEDTKLAASIINAVVAFLDGGTGEER